MFPRVESNRWRLEIPPACCLSRPKHQTCWRSGSWKNVGPGWRWIFHQDFNHGLFTINNSSRSQNVALNNFKHVKKSFIWIIDKQKLFISPRNMILWMCLKMGCAPTIAMLIEKIRLTSGFTCTLLSDKPMQLPYTLSKWFEYNIHELGIKGSANPKMVLLVWNSWLYVRIYRRPLISYLWKRSSIHSQIKIGGNNPVIQHVTTGRHPSNTFGANNCGKDRYPAINLQPPPNSM